MYKHLAIALDGSHNARPALIEAVRIAATANSHLSLVHVICLHDFAVESAGLLDTQALYDEARKQGQAVLDEAANYAREHGVKDISQQLLEAPQGSEAATAQLVEFAEQAGADLLADPSAGENPFFRMIPQEPLDADMVADAIAAEASIDPVMGGVDR